jgi:hypothetical protein
MKILAVSDQVEDRIYELIPQGRFQGIGMVLSCGDLPYGILNIWLPLECVFFASVTTAYSRTARGRMPVPILICRPSSSRAAHGGFGGSIRRPGPKQRCAGRSLSACGTTGRRPNRRRHGRALDILISHSPPFGIQDDDSGAHRGLRAINWLLKSARPRLHLHGHLHDTRRNLKPDLTMVGETAVMNVFPHRELEFPLVQRAD